MEIPKQDYEKASRRIHKALKDYFDIHSFADLSVSEFERVASTTRMLFCREWAYIIPEPDESNFDANKETLRELLKFKAIIK